MIPSIVITNDPDGGRTLTLQNGMVVKETLSDLRRERAHLNGEVTLAKWQLAEFDAALPHVQNGSS